MSKVPQLLFVLCMAGGALAPAWAQVAPGERVIESGLLGITRADFEGMLAGDPRQPLALGQPSSAKLALGTEFGKAFALEAEARRRGVEQDPAVQLKLRNYTQQLLANELLVSVRKGYLKDEARLKAHYEAHLDSYAQPRVRQILVRTPGSIVASRKGQAELTLEQAQARAEALVARLNQGADFAALARTESDDGGAASNGGDLGFITKGATAAAFEAAAYSLPLGQVSRPIRTEYGFHILRVEERVPMSLEMVKGIIANDLAHQELDAVIRDGYKLNTAYFGR